MARYAHAITIAGVGTVDGLYRFCYGRAFFDAIGTVDPNSLYVDGLKFWPVEMRLSIDPVSGRTQLSNQSFELAATALVRSFLLRRRHTIVAKLVADMTATQTTADFDTSGLDGLKSLERERLIIDGSSETNPSSGVYRYNVTRAALATRARRHKSGDLDDRFVYDTLHVRTGRRVQLLRIPLDGSSSYPETVLWTGFTSSPKRVGPVVTLPTDSLLHRIEETPILQDLHRGHADVRSYTLAPGDVPAGHGIEFDVTGDLPFPAAGSNVSSDVPQSLLLLDGQYLIKATTGRIATRTEANYTATAGVNFGTGARFPGLDASGPVREVFSTSADAPSNVDSGSIGDNTLPLASDRGKLILQLLTTTDNDNTAGANGDYDLGIGALAGDIDVDLVDVDSIVAWGRRVGIEHDDLLIGIERAPLKLGGYLRDLLAPTMASLAPTRDGRVRVVSFTDALPYNSSLSLGDDDILWARGYTEDERLVDAIDVINFEYNFSAGLEPDIAGVNDAIKFQRQPHGQHDTKLVRARGVRDSGTARSLAQTAVQRFHEPIPDVVLTTLATKQFDVGDSIRFTSAHITGADGTAGIENTVWFVMSRQEVWSGAVDDRGLPQGDGTHHVVYGLLFTGLIHPRDAYIAPGAKVVSWAASVATVEANAVTATKAAAPDDPLGDGSSRRDNHGFPDGMKVDLYSNRGALLDTGGTVVSTVPSLNQIKVSGWTVTPAAGNWIVPAAYDDSRQTEKDELVYIAKANDKLGAANDDPKTYRT